eukprot:TRINITY_DN2521_c0_g1_i2.p1 TRINITY_DN2521_c0_g1~~TRINITY_DN2521_c0_g1_i2.p1  ORF type:complete len:660 (+),score=142.57 TRINITY_DN2521_c0_g1_i2:169-2148(+)
MFSRVASAMSWRTASTMVGGSRTATVTPLMRTVHRPLAPLQASRAHLVRTRLFASTTNVTRVWPRLSPSPSSVPLVSKISPLIITRSLASAAKQGTESVVKAKKVVVIGDAFVAKKPWATWKKVVLLGGVVWTGAAAFYFSDFLEGIYYPIRSTARFAICVGVGLVIFADYGWSLRGQVPESDEYYRTLSAIHVRSAAKLLALCRFNGGIFVKFGQHIAALEYVLPREYTDTMRVLQARAPSCRFEDVAQVIKEEFGRDVDDIFLHFEREPIASASLAQVHVAYLSDHKHRNRNRHATDGDVDATSVDGDDDEDKSSLRKVAVKVQFPRLRETCTGDVFTISLLVNIAAYIFPKFTFKWLVTEFNKALPLELDFVHEARNSLRVGLNFADDDTFYVPQTEWNLTTARVLTMEFVEGCEVNDLEALKAFGIQPAQVATALTRVFSRQIFVHGFVHCDPHPGNVLVRPQPGNKFKPQIVLLDHGLYRELDDEFRYNYALMWDALIRRDDAAIRETSANFSPDFSYQILCSMLTARAWQSAEETDLTSARTQEEIAAIRGRAANLASEISLILEQVPSDLRLMFKTNDLLRSVNADLGNPINEFNLMMKAVVKCMNAHDYWKDPTVRTRVHGWWRSLSLTLRLFAMDVWLWFTATSHPLLSQ